MSRSFGYAIFGFESYNFFNHTQFNGYNTALGGGGFGAPNRTRLPREIQIGAKLTF